MASAGTAFFSSGEYGGERDARQPGARAILREHQALVLTTALLVRTTVGRKSSKESWVRVVAVREGTPRPSSAWHSFAGAMQVWSNRAWPRWSWPMQLRQASRGAGRHTPSSRRAGGSR